MSAIISSCGKYRYRLERDVQDDGKVFAFFGINPSTADASLDDATVRKWRGFTQRNGGRRFIVGNAFAYRATDVRELGALSLDDALGAEHWEHWAAICKEADVLVPCWGSSFKVPQQHRCGLRALGYFIAGCAASMGKPMLHFGLTANGDPKHPLMLGYDTPLTPWRMT